MIRSIAIAAVSVAIAAWSPLAAASWSKADKDQATKNCMFGAKDQYQGKAQGYCDCVVAKWEKESPDAKKQASIPTKRNMEINNECRPK